MVTIPLGACTGWVRGYGKYPDKATTRKISVGPISVCYHVDAGEDSFEACEYQKKLCKLADDTYCQATKDSSAYVGLMWAVFGLEILQFIYFIAADKIKGLNLTVYAIVMVLVDIAMVCIEISASVKEKDVMDQFFHSKLLSGPVVYSGYVCAFLSCCLVCLQLLTFLAMYVSQKEIVAKNNNSSNNSQFENSHLIPTKGQNETTPYSTLGNDETPAYQSSVDDQPPLYQVPGDEALLYQPNLDVPMYQP